MYILIDLLRAVNISYPAITPKNRPRGCRFGDSLFPQIFGACRAIKVKYNFKYWLAPKSCANVSSLYVIWLLV